MCDTKFDNGKHKKHSAAKDRGYDGLVCRRCIKTKIGYRIKEYKERAEKNKTFSNLTRKELFRVIIHSSFCCKICGTMCCFIENTSRQLTIDHIYPLSLGGMNIKENLAVLCRSCHKKKDNYIPKNNLVHDIMKYYDE